MALRRRLLSSQPGEKAPSVKNFPALKGVNYKRGHSPPQGEAVKLGTGQNAKMDRGQRAVEALDKNE